MPGSFEVAPFDAPLGAEIIGLNLSDVPRPKEIERLRAALAKHLLLVMREQHLTPEQHLSFASCFGTPEPHSFVAGLNQNRVITEIRKEPEQAHNFGGTWHADLTFRSSPPVAAVLLARQVPASGGDTLWSNQYLAYQSLPEAFRAEIDDLRALHSSQQAFGGYNGVRELLSAVHPLAPLHSITGRRHLFANPVSIDRIVGLQDSRGREVLGFLYKHAISAAFQYRHRWRAGDVVVWDNRATLHRAVNDYSGQKRVMHRISVGSPASAM